MTEHLTTAMSLFHEMGMRFRFEKAEAEMQHIAVSPHFAVSRLHAAKPAQAP